MDRGRAAGVEIRKIRPDEQGQALQVVWRTFLQFEAPDYTEKGVQTFYRYIMDRDAVDNLTFWGAFKNDQVVGVAATRNAGNHIALLFVDGEYHRQGIGRQLFEKVLAESSGVAVTVNSSPYAFQVYRKLGFTETDSEQIVDGIRFIPMIFVK